MCPYQSKIWLPQKSIHLKVNTTMVYDGSVCQCACKTGFPHLYLLPQPILSFNTEHQPMRCGVLSTILGLSLAGGPFGNPIHVVFVGDSLLRYQYLSLSHGIAKGLQDKQCFKVSCFFFSNATVRCTLPPCSFFRNSLIMKIFYSVQFRQPILLFYNLWLYQIWLFPLCIWYVFLLGFSKICRYLSLLIKNLALFYYYC